MPHLKSSPMRRRAALLVAVVLAAALAVPVAAHAATVPISTLIVSSTYQYKAAPFTMSGRVSKAYHGKRLTLEIRKPGRTWWTVISQPLIKTDGRWSYKYTPKLGGKFFIRARYAAPSAGMSRTATLAVKNGPGVRYQLTLASTTSFRDAGLWEAMRPLFARDCPEYAVKAAFLGTGASIALGGSGDADVLLVHSPVLEVPFMSGRVSGALTPYKGATRFKVMYNDYVLVGPKNNPAGILDADTPVVAFGKIASTNSIFISRNDNSGTNTKEKEIWASIGNPQTGQSWYKATGTMGMAQALSAADQQAGYTLADRGTWLNCSVTLKTVTNLKIVDEGSSVYKNQYSVIEVTRRTTAVPYTRNPEGAQDFRRWIMSAQAKSAINAYGVDTFGFPLFRANPGYW